MSDIKQVIVVRKDLKMRRGKESAQVAHASMKVFFDRAEVVLDRDEEYTRYGIPFYLLPEMIMWMKSSFTKIVLSCDSEEELFKLQKQAEEAGIVNALILDNGLTEFKKLCPDCGIRVSLGVVAMDERYDICPTCNGTGKINKQTYTCLAIGPDYSDKIDKITGYLKLR